ncbi:prokaryotic molybdopterin-containing oxidoreductase family, iron-sulfur binding subunit [Halobiforma haloterrestris]|uniref:Prokaryotic molybdopterin-containing oxidoreductase family, iron-sulfur binding subunit n=1 Tax=Natronobacterium haloterrestre TaxID=148448 RepID=A0A1I1FIG7_NATHA|nr:4Fe-4S ferredoxin N-terminal domain-containing protein [Halobiforma haloterrestris]SFB98782.1 prokaryotic molybdopterin-containing oxidoreductase family, iron-sulfur binding subunit [Halobiforma haloterrestris]
MSTDDESFHPLGNEWENELETMLDDTEYDTELGMEMAQDAFRVTKGELSEAEFHEKYHEDVMEEFGEDNRPTAEAFEAAQEEAKGAASRMLSKFEGDGEEGRREAMKKMGAGAAAVGLGAWGTVENGNEPDPEPDVAAAAEEEEDPYEHDRTQWGMALDLERCDGCLSCVTACATENQLDSGVNWMYVLEFEDPGESANTNSSLARTSGPSPNRLIRPCQHCTDAPCEKVCPTTARHTRDKDGLVLTDYDVCIGCRYCQVACPYGVNYFQWDEPDVSTEDIAEHHEELGQGDHMTDDRGRWVDSRAPRGVMSKCTMCPSRQDGHMGEEYVGTTACQQACPPGAIQFGNMSDEESDPKKYAANPSRGRTLERISPPSADALEESLDGADDDLESVLEATDLDEDTLALMKAVEITGELGTGDGKLAGYEREFQEALDALADHGLDLDSEDVLVELDLADETDEDEEFDGPSVEDAQQRLEAFTGSPESNFRLLEDMGTNPNIVYLGQEPGPHAEQTEPTGATSLEYEQLSYEAVNGETIDLVDNRKEVLDEETVGDTGWSL